MTWPKHGVAAATLAACVAASAPLSAQIQTPVSATSAGDTGSFTVPGGVCFVRLDVAGGLGGASYVPDIVEGGRGARIGARVPVTPGAQLDFSVGGAGVNAVVSVPAAGGVGGGGSGGGSGSFGGGGGGGASVVALDGVPIVVAGGGGGGGGALLGSVGGDAGGAGGTGADGGPGTDDFPATAGAADGTGGLGGYDLHVLAFGGGGGGGVGGGGTVQQDGPGGSGGDGNGVYGGGGGSGGEETSPGGHGSDASPGAGGLGSTVGNYGPGGNGGLGFGGGGGAAVTGGGGGAGYGGGGGGALGGGGAGGSSFVVNSADDDVAYSFNYGDGFVVITYDPVADACPTTAFSVSAATDTGLITGTLTGPAPCSITSASALTAEGAAGAPPDGVALPHGLVDLSIEGCPDGATVTLTVTYPEPLPVDTTFWKYGPTSDDASPHWYEITPTSIVGATVTYTITDGGLGDDDLTANGTILDPAGPGVTATAVPTMPAMVSVALAALLLGAGASVLWRRGSLAAPDVS